MTILVRCLIIDSFFEKISVFTYFTAILAITFMNKERGSAQWLVVSDTISSTILRLRSLLADMKSSYFLPTQGTDDVEWCFSQVKGTVEEEVTEGS